MGHLPSLLVFVLIEMHIIISQQKSLEDVNSVLDKLIQQVNNSEPNYNDESPDPLESYYPVPIDTDNEPGNDSNIYYFKTYMAPQIEFKNDAQRSDKPVQMVNKQYEALFEDKLLPGTLTARSGNNDELEVLQSRKSDEVDKKMKLIENFIKKQKVNDLSSERSPYGRFLPKSLKMLHKYPEIVVGELGNDSEASTPSDTEFKNKTRLQDVPLKKRSSTANSVTVFQSSVKPTPKYEFQKPDPLKTKISPQEKIVPESNEELKNLIDLITQNTELYNSLLKEIRERDSREQNILLEKILKRLSEYKPKEDEPNFESRAAAPYPVAIPLSSKIGGSGLLQNLQRNVVSASYLHTPVVTYHLPPRVPTTPYLSRGVLSFSRNNALQRPRLGSALVNRGISRYSFGRNLPVRYG